jgi:hypothetical protein
MFKAEPVDQYGNLIDRHNLWEMVGVRYRRSLFPGFSDVAEFSFACPGGPLTNAEVAEGGVRAPIDGSAVDQEVVVAMPSDVGELTVTARLMYRKADQFLLNFLFGPESGITSPVTVMSEAEASIAVGPGT